MKDEIQRNLIFLQQFNNWRRGLHVNQLHPEIIGQAIDFAIEILKQKLKEEEDDLPRTDPAILPPTEGVL